MSFAFVIPKGIMRHRPSRSELYAGVDWTKTNAELSKVLGKTQEAVRQARKVVAPEQYQLSGRKRILAAWIKEHASSAASLSVKAICLAKQVQEIRRISTGEELVRYAKKNGRSYEAVARAKNRRSYRNVV